MTPAFERWLREHVTSADRRAALAEAADGLVDMYNAERDELEDVLTISAWPAFARNRFLRAWQALRDAGRAVALAADEGTAELVLRPTAGAANRPAAGAAPEEGHGPPTALGVQSLGASAGLAGAPRPEITERVRVVAKTNAASPGIAALHYGRTGVVTKRTPAWNYVQLDATRYKRSETIPCRNRDLVLIPRQTPANPELPHALAVLGRGAPGAPGIDDDDDNEDDADANAGTQLDLDVVTDDADSGADEQGLVLAGCNGALFSVSGQVQAASALGGWKKQLLRGHDRLCTTCKATYTSGHFCPTCETRLFVVDQPMPPPETAEEAALPSPAATTASDKPTVPVTPNIPKVKALASPVRPEYAETPTRKQITQQMCGESTGSSSSNSDTDEDFSPDGAPVRSAPVESDTEDDARPPPNDDTDDDLPLPPPVAKEEPDDDDEREFFTCSF